MNYSRRDFLKAGTGAAALMAAGRPILAAAESKKIPIGVQLYSVRQAAEKDLAGVLKGIAEMGYQGVEFAGYYGWSAKDIRKQLDDNRLVCCGTHAQWPTVQADQFESTVEFNKTIGNKYLIVPSLPRQQTANLEALEKTAAFFTEMAKKAQAVGMVAGYHAHGGDFEKVEGTTPWEVIFDGTPKEFAMQLDVGNAIGGGGDPYAILDRYPGRSKTIHLKEHGGKQGAVVGEGDVVWQRIFKLCETTGGTEWYIVEQESYAAAPLESIRQCLVNLRKMGK